MTTARGFHSSTEGKAAFENRHGALSLDVNISGTIASGNGVRFAPRRDGEPGGGGRRQLGRRSLGVDPESETRVNG